MPLPVATLRDACELGYLDDRYYAEKYQLTAEQSPTEHYLSEGWVQGHKPNEWFDPDYYSAQLSEEISQPPLVHYRNHGWHSGLLPCTEFDPLGYVTSDPGSLVAGYEPLQHYLQHGRHAGVKPRVRDGVRVRRAVAGSKGQMHPHHLKVVTDPVKAEAPEDGFDSRSLHIAWIVPQFSPGAGGHMAIFRAIHWLERIGHRCTIWIDYPSDFVDGSQAQELLFRHFTSVSAEIRLLRETDVIVADVVMATDRWTVWSAVRQSSARLIAYFVQDLEPLFYPAGTDEILARATYQMKLFSICSSPWLRRKVIEQGSDAISFTYPADVTVYNPGAPRAASESAMPLIAFYARPATGRRAVELAELGLLLLARSGVSFRVAFFGQELDDSVEWPFDVEYHGVLDDQALATLYRRADVGLVLSATNYSISAVEMMACGLPVVDIAGESTLETYPAGTVTLAEPNAQGIANALTELLNNPRQRADQASAALAWITKQSWPDIAKVMAEALVSKLEAGATGRVKDAPTLVVGRKRVGVFIPTYNGSAHIERVLAAVEQQSPGMEMAVLCIDSGSTDDTLEIISRFPNVKVECINQKEFNHGGTRNRGVELLDSDYVAFLTQDAVPASSDWLAHLVAPLRAIPGAAGVFGRHLPHDDASPYVVRDLTAHFDLFKNAPLFVNRATDKRRYEMKDVAWLAFLRFYSDNNSCLSTEVWDRLRLPTINFGEDQVWAWQVVQAGYTKCYSDRAAVFHSHNYDAAKTYQRARTEAAFFHLQFDPLQTSGPTDEDVEYRIRELCSRDFAYGRMLNLPKRDIEAQFQLNRSFVEGQRAGTLDTEVHY